MPTLGDTPALGRLFRQRDLTARRGANRSFVDFGLADAAGIRAAAQGSEAGELFQYVIDTPVSLVRQKSAMLPIISERLQAHKVSIYNERAQVKYPLNGVRLKNTSSMHLMQGPITVFDADTYAGDARMDDLAAGQERLISYALDIKTEVEPRSEGGSNEVVSVALRKGTLLVSRKGRRTKDLLGPESRSKSQNRAHRASRSTGLGVGRAQRAWRTDPRGLPFCGAD